MDAQIKYGVDISRGGDVTVLTIKAGLQLHSFQGKEAEAILGWHQQELETIMQGIIGEDLPIKARQTGERSIHSLAINLNKIKQRQALRAALYGED